MPSNPSPAIAMLQRELADSIIRFAPLDDLRIILACGAKINEPVTQGLRPLHYAAYQNYTECVKLLLIRGADVDAVDDIGYTALHLCAERGYYDLMVLLMQHGASVRFTDVQRSDSDMDIPYNSLGNPPRATIADEPLRLAIKNGHKECAELLLKYGADVSARYFLGSEINLISPLNITFMDMLLRYGANPDSRDRAGLTPLMKAARHPQGYAAAKMLLSYGADVNAMTDERHDFRTVLHYAVLSGNAGIVNLLLSAGANVNFPSEFKKPTPLDFAILRSNVEMVKTLLNAGADVNNAGSPIIGTALHLALSEQIENRYDIASLLLFRGADPNAITTDERGPLLKPPIGEYLNSVDNPEPEIIQLLLRYGARVVLNSQVHDPIGILKSMYRLKDDSSAFDLILDAAESCSLNAVTRCTLLNRTQKQKLSKFATTPLSLKRQVRLKIRRLIGGYGPSLLEKIASLPIPRLMREYLQFSAY